MKKLFILLSLLFVSYLNVYAQYLPNWINMGMSKNDIEKVLNIEQLLKKQDNLYVYVLESTTIIYQFDIDDIKGLKAFWIVSVYFNMANLVNDFTLIFGDPVYRDNKYWWFNKSKLPDDVIAICILNERNSINITYFYTNYF
jgi:hypothetical protein